MVLPTHSRRYFVLGTLSILFPYSSACSTSRPAVPRASPTDEERSLAELEDEIGGRLGVLAVDTGNGRQLEYRADERFALCSTFKWLLAAAVLDRVDRGTLQLDEFVPYTKSDLLSYAPVTSQHVAEGSMTIGSLAEAAVTLSDNTAANLLLQKLGGPAALTHFIRTTGDPFTRLDRNEPTLNTNIAGDVRDTTSPRAMVGSMRRILCEDTLSPSNREQLLRWLRASETGKNRLRAGFPADWVVGDKTGSCENNAINDVAIAIPPGRHPILVAVYTSGAATDLGALNAAHVEIARFVARVF